MAAEQETDAEAAGVARVSRLGLADVAANLVFWPSMIVFATICGIVAFGSFPITVWFDRERRVGMWLACVWAWLVLWPLRLFRIWRIEFRRLEQLPRGFCGVIAPNHASQFDILVLHASMIQARWVSKTSVFWIPVVGWAMWVIGYVGLRRKEQKSIREMTRRCAKSLETGVPLVIFPEGTRSRDGQLQRFKNGAFLIAKLASRPVYPVAVSGTFDALPPGKLLLRAGVRIVVTFLPPIPAEVTEREGPGEVAEQCHAAIAGALAGVRLDEPGSRGEKTSA